MTNVIWSKLLAAMIMVESGGNHFKVGDKGQSYGSLQIQKGVVEDVNRHYGTNYKHEDMFNSIKAKDVAKKYMYYHGNWGSLRREPTAEDYTRIFDGGSKGYKRETTKKYWKKVDKELKRLSVIPGGR